MPDMMTIGQGKQSLAEYRAQFALWVVLGAPLIIGCDIRMMDAAVLELLTSAEVPNLHYSAFSPPSLPLFDLSSHIVIG